jgi:ribosomal protein S17
MVCKLEHANEARRWAAWLNRTMSMYARLLPTFDRKPGSTGTADCAVVERSGKQTAGPNTTRRRTDMAKFKVGDKVRVIDTSGSSRSKMGDIAKVTRVHDEYQTDILIDVEVIGEDRTYSMLEKRFEKYVSSPSFDFKPGDIVVPKYNRFGVAPSKIVGYYEDGHKQYPKLTEGYASVPIVVYIDNPDGYPSWDRADDVVLYERPKAEEPVKVEPEKNEWTTVSKQLIGGSIEVRIQTRKVGN